MDKWSDELYQCYINDDGESIEKLFYNHSGITYDDFIMLPRYTDFNYNEVNLITKISKRLDLKLPFLSSPMDTLTGEELAIALGKSGGLGVIHYNQPIKDQTNMISNIKSENILAAAAVSTHQEDRQRILELNSAKVDIIVVDSSHGNSKYQIDTIKFIKDNCNNIEVIGGNVVTMDGAIRLIEANVDAIKIGMGSGSICTTQEVTGCGRSQATAVHSIYKVARHYNLPIIADGGISKYSHIAKALTIGASAVMMGYMFAGTNESLGKTQYRGMASKEAMVEGGRKRYGVESTKIIVPQGVSGNVENRGSIVDVINKMSLALKQSLQILGCMSIDELHANNLNAHIRTELRSLSSIREGGVHDVSTK